MRIGIDARFYGPIGGGGLGRYIKEIVDHLESADSMNDYVIFLRKENWDDYKPNNQRFKKVLAPYQWYGWKEQIFLPWKIRKEKVDLMHFPHFNAPFLYTGRFVLTVHDLILLKFPSKKATTLSPIYFKFKHLIYKFVIKNALNKAKKIIAPSQFVKEDIIKYFNIPADKLVVIYEGVTDVGKKNSFGENKFVKNVDKLADKKLKIGYNNNMQCEYANDASMNEGLLALNTEDPANKEKILNWIRNEKYILYVGNAYPHKNLEKLIAAFSLIVESGEMNNLRLVLVGVKNYFYSKLIRYIYNYYQDLKDKIIFWGYAADYELQNLYEHASLYVFPSLQEGFGLPPLEAMSFGVPVVSSVSSCLPEILGDAAWYFDAEDEKDMAKKIIEAMKDEHLRSDLIEKGFKRVKRYSWKQAAVETLNVYKKYGGAACRKSECKL